MKYRFAGATISPCGEFRYRLWRYWNPDLTPLVFIMLNPSTADADVDDPTIRKCVGFADRYGYGGIEIVNLFGFRATDPAELKKRGFPEGPDNAIHLRLVLRLFEDVVCAWGGNAPKGAGSRIAALVAENGRWPCKLQALRIGKNGAPWHPLYVPYATELVKFKP